MDIVNVWVIILLALGAILILAGVTSLKDNRKKKTPVDDFQRLVIDINIHKFEAKEVKNDAEN